VEVSADDWTGCTSMTVNGWGRALVTTDISSSGAFKGSFTVPVDAPTGQTQLSFAPRCQRSTWMPFAVFTVTAGSAGSVPTTSISHVDLYQEGVLVYIRITYTGPATGFGFKGIKGSGWAEENHPFASPSYGRVSPGRIDYPFNHACGTANQYESDVEFWLNNGSAKAVASTEVRVKCTGTSTPGATSVRAEFVAPFSIHSDTDLSSPLAASQAKAVCEGVSGVLSMQHEHDTGKLGFNAFAWGGFCGAYNVYIPKDRNRPTQKASAESLLGARYHATTNGTYRIRAEFELQGEGHAKAGPAAAEILAAFVPGKIGDILDAAGVFELANPAKLLPSAVVVDNSLLLRVNSAQVVNSGALPDAGDTSVLDGTEDVKFEGAKEVSTTVKLKKGDQISILAGLSASIQSWGNASGVAKPLDSKLKRIVIERTGP
jgi:hypothetical protein